MWKRMTAPPLCSVPGLRNPKVDRNVSLSLRPKNSDVARRSNGVGEIQDGRGAEAGPVFAEASTCNCLAHMGWIRWFAALSLN